MKPSKTIIIPIGIFLAALLVIGGEVWYVNTSQSGPSTTAPLAENTEQVGETVPTNEPPETVTPGVAATDPSSGLPAGEAGTIIPTTTTDCTDDLDTTCWNTYRNEAYGFSFRFPGGWEVQGIPTKDLYVDLLPINKGTETTGSPRMHFTISSDATFQNASGLVTLLNTKKFVFKGRQAIEWTMKHDGIIKNLHIQMTNGKFLSIDYGDDYDEDSVDAYDRVMEIVIKSIEFTS